MVESGKSFRSELRTFQFVIAISDYHIRLGANKVQLQLCHGKCTCFHPCNEAFISFYPSDSSGYRSLTHPSVLMSNLCPPKAEVDLVDQQIMDFTMVLLWNLSIPPQIRLVQSVSMFKTAIRTRCIYIYKSSK